MRLTRYFQEHILDWTDGSYVTRVFFFFFAWYFSGIERSLKGQLMAVFTLEDEQIVSGKQIVWCANGTNNIFDEQIVWY